MRSVEGSQNVYFLITLLGINGIGKIFLYLVIGVKAGNSRIEFC